MLFEVQNMTCSHCVRTITGAIHAIDGEAQVFVSLADKTVKIDGRLDAVAAIVAMAEEGYAAERIDEADSLHR
ncbi:heavy-metal-associated domain-containing protein [Arenimonas oryziterrae]|uniref:HMA domain-containing protein n=1 Tax=Arenimonas oryziterrae DSM 21050 = YC6267 TaxID=1121015 RepID=A0A091AWE9_9GAMM|nr:heavy-metal-associated domain-containing protein [Arenimonas oryziterrae]KFN42959.1 hypothetical protein N789_12610 [Arenimonas oryziterrae DSM 21050 = YC6267]